MTGLPAAAHLRFTVQFTDDGATVAVAGELDAASAPELDVVLGALVDRGHHRVTIGCEQLTFIDAAGLRTFTRLHHRLHAEAGRLQIQGLAPSLYRVLDLTGLAELLEVSVQEPAPHRPGANDEWAAERFAAQLSRLVAESAQADARAATLSQLIAVIPELIGACDGVSVTLRRGEHLVTAAASDDLVRGLDEVQYAEAGGPCVEATERGQQVHDPQPDGSERWTAFTHRARGHGIRSVLSTPITDHDDPRPVGALNLYSRDAPAFPAGDRALARTLVALVLLVLRTPVAPATDRLDARIRDAFDSRDVIARAQGVLMERLGVDARDAFDVLRRDSVRTTTPLRARALAVIKPATPRTTRTVRSDAAEYDTTLDQARRDASLTMTDLWLRYFALGGNSTPVELEAYLLGALHAPTHERDLLAHAIAEARVERGSGHRTPDDE